MLRPTRRCSTLIFTDRASSTHIVSWDTDNLSLATYMYIVYESKYHRKMVSLIEVKVTKLMCSCKGSSEVLWTEQEQVGEGQYVTTYYRSSIPLLKKEEYIIGK